MTFGEMIARYGGIQKMLEEASSEDDLLEVVEDENGEEVGVWHSVTRLADGKVLDDSLIALDSHGMFYPVYADKNVQEAVRRLSRARA